MGEWRKRVLAATATVRRPNGRKAAGTAVLIDRAADGNSGQLHRAAHVITAMTGSDPLPTKVMVGFPGLPPLPAIPLASHPAKSGVPVDGACSATDRMNAAGAGAARAGRLLGRFVSLPRWSCWGIRPETAPRKGGGGRSPYAARPRVGWSSWAGARMPALTRGTVVARLWTPLAVSW